MNNKKVLIRVGTVIAAILVLLLLLKGCPPPTNPHGNKYEVQTTKVNSGNDSNVTQVFLLMDPSGSMKGYLNFRGFKDVNQNIVNNISKPLDRLSSKFHVEIKVKYGLNGDYKTTSISELQTKMIRGESFNDATTMLDEMISDAVQKVTDTTLSMLVSDMVLSYGKSKLKDDHWLNQNDLSNLGARIHTALVGSKNVEVLLLQYYSDFNGNYYYNCTENLEKGDQYKGVLMKERPYYIMVFGNKAMLESLLDAGVFAKEDNLYASFGLDDSNMESQKLHLIFNPESCWVWDNITEDMNSELTGTIWTKANLGSEKETFIVEFNKFDIPIFLNQKYEIGDYHLSKVIDNVEETTDPSNPTLLRFKVTLKPYDLLPKSGEFEFTLISRNDWVGDASVPKDDDVNIETIASLEKRTWGLNTIVKNIDEAKFGNKGRSVDVVAMVKFNLSKE